MGQRVVNNLNHKKALVLLSGGLDSFACAHFLKKQGYKVNSIFFNFNQASVIEERKSAKKIAQYLNIELEEVSVVFNSSFTAGEIRGRNAFLLSCALTQWKESNGLVALGIHAGTQYFDCSESFLNLMNSIFDGCTANQVRVFAPFISWGKSQIFEYCKINNIPLNLTYSCEMGTVPTCGSCLSCQDRKKYEFGC